MKPLAARAFLTRRVVIAVASTLVLSAGLAWAADKPKPGGKKPATRVLFVGNSYTSVNDLPAIVRAIGFAAKPPVDIVVESITPGGFTLEGHLAAEGKDSPRARIAAGAFDFVVLQEQSQRPVVEPAKMLEAARALAKDVAAVKAEPVWYATWARKAKPEQQVELDKSYAACLAECGGRLAPVGDAWQLVIGQKDAKDRVELYDKDGSHPSPAGSYLAGLVMYATLTGNSVEGLPAKLAEPLPQGDERVLVELSSREARLLQKAAADAIAAKKPAKR